MVRGGPANRAVKRAKIFALTKGFRGRRKNCYSLAVRAAHKALLYAYVGRRLKKRDMRKLWIQRINYAAQINKIGYGRFMNSLVKSDIRLNRKVLSELAIHEPKTFQAIAELAKQKWTFGFICAMDQDPFTLIDEYPRIATTKPPRTAVLYEPKEVFNTNTGKIVLETAV